MSRSARGVFTNFLEEIHMSLKHVAITALSTAIVVAVIFRVPAIRTLVVGQ